MLRSNQGNISAVKAGPGLPCWHNLLLALCLVLIIWPTCIINIQILNNMMDFSVFKIANKNHDNNKYWWGSSDLEAVTMISYHSCRWVKLTLKYGNDPSGCGLITWTLLKHGVFSGWWQKRKSKRVEAWEGFDVLSLALKIGGSHILASRR